MAVLISRTGAVKDVDILYAPSPAYGQAATKAVKQWTYAPIVHNGRLVEGIMELRLKLVPGA
jgi:hypothetical protein